MDIVKFKGFRNSDKYTKKDKKFEDSLYDYLLIATKLVRRLCAKDLRIEILRDEDALSSMAHAIMMADWRWDKDYKSKKNRTRKQYSYRAQCFLWEVKSYLLRKNSVYNTKFRLSLNYAFQYDDSQLYSKIIDKTSFSVDPVAEVIKKEEHEIINDKLGEVLNDRERICVTMYYIDKCTYKEIGKKFGLCKERIRQIICYDALPKLRRSYGNK